MTTNREILATAKEGMEISEKQAFQLLQISNSSDEFYSLLSVANDVSRREYNKGMVFAQIGINAEPCSKNCKFCSMGREHYVLDSIWEKDTDAILLEAKLLIEQGIDSLFLMTTANYDSNKFLEIAKQVRTVVPDKVGFVANIGDFNDEIASKLQETGFTGVYHIHRLREGVDTDIDPALRINTLEAAKKRGLEIFYCVEPIGPEHRYDEIITEMFRAKQYSAEVMAVMRRIPVPGTPLFSKGQIPAIELTKIAAVTRIATRPKRAMNAHEPNLMALFAGVNMFFAEVGANPRDVNSNTEKSIGLSVKGARKMLWEVGYE
ncbi:MAG TPA: radical SAM protein [Negativicutes bacterium]